MLLCKNLRTQKKKHIPNRGPQITSPPGPVPGHSMHGPYLCHEAVFASQCSSVAPGFKNKTRYTPYVSPGS